MSVSDMSGSCMSKASGVRMHEGAADSRRNLRADLLTSVSPIYIM